MKATCGFIHFGKDGSKSLAMIVLEPTVSVIKYYNRDLVDIENPTGQYAEAVIDDKALIKPTIPELVSHLEHNGYQFQGASCW